jgi:hypothetical protein
MNCASGRANSQIKRRSSGGKSGKFVNVILQKGGVWWWNLLEGNLL